MKVPMLYFLIFVVYGTVVHGISIANYGGGRATATPNMPSLQTPQSISSSLKPTESRLTIIQITDVYTLQNFASLKTLIETKKKENPNTISVLTGDFLAPYLLSSIDKGYGMMNAIAKTPIDYLTW